METIRLIRKSGNNDTIGDRMVHIEKLTLNPVDRPAYVEIRGVSPVELVLGYPHSKEAVGVASSSNGLLEVKYGKISGRIKTVVVKEGLISDIDKFTLGRLIKANGAGVRFVRNVDSQLSMVKSILSEIQRER